MFYCIIIFIHGLCIGWSYGLIEYTNDCGLISVTEPAIDGRYVVFRFTPYSPGEDDVKAVWRYAYSGWGRDYDVSNSSYHYFVSNLTTDTYTMFLKCDIENDDGRQYWMEFATSSSSECESKRITISVLDAPTGCGILYKRTVNITAGNDVVLEHYAPYSELQDQPSVRLLKRRSQDCRMTDGCQINSTLYEEEYQNFNDVIVYRIGNFTSAMNGDYTVQCIDGSGQTKATNVVTVVLPVPPQSLTFLNTTDIDGCHGCISGNYHSYGDVDCYVKGGTSPVTVTISIPSEDVGGTCDLSKEYNVCSMKLKMYDKYHLKDIRCEASNNATDAPLTTTTSLYVIRKPTDPVLHAPLQYEGDVNMSCSGYGDRPKPELSLLINGSHVTNITEVHLAEGRSIRLGYLRREWNGANISCCMRHPYYMDPKCSTTMVSYYFSPESINVTQLSSQTTDKVHFVQIFQCVISNANPACRAVWSYPDGIGLPVGTEETNETTGQRRETTLSTLPLNVTREVNGEEVRCRAVCEEFNGTHIWESHSIRVPYPPTITINTSTDVSMFEGESVMVKCQVDSLLEAELSWVNGRNETIASFDCGEDAICVEVLQASVVDAGIYSCRAKTDLFEARMRTFELKITSTSTKQQQHPSTKPPLIWIIAGLAATLMLVLLVMVAVIVRKRRARNGKIPATETISLDGIKRKSVKGDDRGMDMYDDINDSVRVNESPARIETRPVGETDGEGIALQDAPDNMYANTSGVIKLPIREVKDVQNDVEYSAVIPKPKRKKKAIAENASTKSTPETQELMYADLDLETTGATANQSVKFKREPATEYVSIDFTRVGEPLPDDDTENIYVNQ